MNLKQFANVDSFCRDLDTGTEISWEEYMARIIGKLGLHNIKPYLPYDLEFLKEKLTYDGHLNNTLIHAWDAASGYIFYIDKNTLTRQYERSRYGLCSLLIRNGITYFSVSECVAVLKTAAKMLVREVYDEEKRDN